MRRLAFALALAAPVAAHAQTPPVYPGSSGQIREADGTFCPDAARCGGVPRGGSTIATGQISVGTSATLVVAARANRQSVGVTVTTAVQCAFGPAGVTLSTGWPLAAVAYASDQWHTSAAIYGVCASTATVAYREQY